MIYPTCQDVELEWNLTSYAANLNVNKTKNRYANVVPCKDGTCNLYNLWEGFITHFHGYQMTILVLFYHCKTIHLDLTTSTLLTLM